MKNDIKRWLNNEGKLFLKEIGIKREQIVLDFGCGAGHYTIPAAKVVGKKGKIYALDKDAENLAKLIKIAKSKGIKNIEIVKTSGELKIPIKDKSVDVVLLYDVLHYIDNRKKIYDEVYKVLKIGGLLSIYPKHYKLDEPLWTLTNLKLKDITKEIEAVNFYLERKTFKKLMHDDNYNKGYILNFRKKYGNF
ncbi:class I SAM-dependent methyltransferase [candidate division WOR-3 bacterium]|nr:class I SAM-dependent methyltransferase [candidate division WOR-3 bacterium]